MMPSGKLSSFERERSEGREMRARPPGASSRARLERLQLNAQPWRWNGWYCCSSYSGICSSCSSVSADII